MRKFYSFSVLQCYRYIHAYTGLCIISIKNRFESKYCLESIYGHFCYNTYFGSANLFWSIWYIEHNALFIFAYVWFCQQEMLNKGRRLPSAEWKPPGIYYQTHTGTLLSDLPTTSVHPTCYEPYPNTPAGGQLSFWLQDTLLPGLHTMSQAAVLQNVMSCHFSGKVSYLL